MHKTLRYLSAGIALLAQILYASEAISSIPKEINPEAKKQSGIERIIENTDGPSLIIPLVDNPPLDLDQALDHFNLSLIYHRRGLSRQAQDEYNLGIATLPKLDSNVFGLYDSAKNSSGNLPPEYIDNLSAGKIFLRQQKYN